MRYLIGALLWLACGTSVAAAAEIDFGRYHALVIGINDYEYLPQLETAVNDASAVHDVLSREYGYRSTLLLNPTRRQVIQAFDKLRAELGEDDNLLIFYAGHGVLDRPTGEGFWLTVKATEDSQLEWLPVSTVTRLLKASLVRHALVVVDSCYSGTLTRDAPAALATGPARQAELERLISKRARKALTSGGLEPVNDGGGDGHSVFTRAFLESLRDNREIIDGYQLYRSLRRYVVLNANQTPEYADIRLAGDEGGDFLFVPEGHRRRATAASAAAAPPAPGPDKEALFWQSIEDSQVAADYLAYLEQYPDGAFAALARARAERYGESAAKSAEPSPGRQAALPPAATEVKLEPVEATYVLRKNANVREQPTTRSAVVATFASGTEFYVSARTLDNRWLQVAQDGGPLGFIYAPLLQELGAWQAARRQEKEEAEARRAAMQRDAEEAVEQRAPRTAPRETDEPRSRQAEESEQPTSPPQVALRVPAEPDGPDGTWRLKVVASSFSDGKLGGIDTAVEVRSGRYESGLISRGRFRLWVSFEIDQGRIRGSLTVAPDSSFSDQTFKFAGSITGDGYVERLSGIALRRTMGGTTSQDLDVDFCLERVE